MLRKSRQKILASLLTGAMLCSMCSIASATEMRSGGHTTSDDLPTVNDIQSIQAYTDETMYGTGVVEVKITYKNGTDLQGLTADSYILEDRGSLSPDFGQIKIDSIQVNRQIVTLTISGDTTATEDNKLVYTGADPEGSRVRNAFGIYCTGAWYRDTKGTIHYGSSDKDAYENNTTGMGYQARACLELRLRHAWEDSRAAACLADDKGQYNAAGLWKKTIDRQFGKKNFQTFADAGIRISSTAATAADGTQDPYIRGYIYIPQNYKPANGIVFTLQGQGISYWKLPDGTDNDGTGIMYDSATTSWADKGAIVVNIHDRSSARQQDGFYKNYDFVLDDVNVMKYLINKYKITGSIVLQGNSRGTMASSVLIKALAGQPYSPKEQAMGYTGPKDKILNKSVYNFTIGTFICQNGSFGGNNIYTQKDYEAVAKTGLRVWCFNGEQDANDIETVAAYKQAVAATGSDVSDDDIRLTAYPSEITSYWGESDHSTTRMNGWYFDDAAYYGPDLKIVDGGIVYNTKLKDGDTYTLRCRGSAADSSKKGYKYTVYDDLYQVWALKGASASILPHDLDAVKDLQKNFSQAAQLPLTGYYTKKIDVNGNGIMDDSRTVKVYIAPEASIRSYFTVVALPDGVDTYRFLSEQGWINLANEKGEGLFILEPGSKGWGSPAEEATYLNAATAFLKSGNNANAQNVFSTFGDFYLSGYGKGAAALEQWAAQNPIFVISQAYVDGTSTGSSRLARVASTPYNGVSANGDITGILNETLKKVGIDGRIAPKDVPVPTWFVGYTGSESYWKAANDCVSPAIGGIYYQNIDSDAYQTYYSNQQLKAVGAAHGISQVKISNKSATAAEIYDWMSEYTRYDTTFAYSNCVAFRLDYTAARVAAQQDAKDGKTNKTLSDGTRILAQNGMQIDGHGMVQVGVIAFSDNSGDGEYDPREYILFIPEGFAEKELPVMMIYPGNSQTDAIFMDSTLWWQVAEEKGIALAFICETYSASPSSVSHADSDKFYASLITLLKETIDGKLADLDFTRIYGSGQSAGSNTTQGFAVTNPEFFAAVASTSGTPFSYDGAANRAIPSMLVSGQMDAGNMADGFASTNLQSWASYLLNANGITAAFAADAPVTVTSADSRHPNVYTWSKSVSGATVPMLRWAQCLLRPHNCYPSDITMLWDFLEHYRFVKRSDGSLIRYYSPSAFAKNDSVVIDSMKT